jgi:hypothetical protein
MRKPCVLCRKIGSTDRDRLFWCERWFRAEDRRHVELFFSDKEIEERAETAVVVVRVGRRCSLDQLGHVVDRGRPQQFVLPVP